MRQESMRVALDLWVDPADVFVALFADSSHSFWLDSGPAAIRGVSYLGGAHEGSLLLTADASAGTVTRQFPLSPELRPVTTPGSIFAELAAAVESAPPSDHDAPGFRLGWVGWLGYALAAQTVGVPVSSGTSPDAAFLWVDRAIAFDHETRTVSLLLLPSGDDAADARWVDETRAAIARAPRRAGPVHPATTPPWRWRHDPAHYESLVLACQESIREGDAYLLCLTNEIIVDARPDPVELALRLRELSPSHHGGLLRFGEHALVSASPEQFLLIDADRTVSTKPIKGTRPRGDTPERDSELSEELRTSEKERAENLMIVDLMRNDLTRVAKVGSVSVPVLLDVESYAQVHQLVSTIRAELADDVTSLDVVASCFPAGSMTGTPKRRAIEILDELEKGPRGSYSGVFGYLGLDGAVDLAVTIRTIALDGSTARIGAGGGITALSDAPEEYEETRIKARALLTALGADPNADVTAGA